MNGRLGNTIRFPIQKLFIDFSNIGWESSDQWEDVTDYVLEVSGSKEKSGEGLGTITSDFTNFVVDNSESVFNNNNTKSPFFGKVKPNLRYKLMVGFKDEELVEYASGSIEKFIPTWKDKKYSVKTVDFFKSFKKTTPPKTSYQDVSWEQLVNELCDKAGLPSHIVREIPDTDYYYEYFEFEEENCFESLRKLMEIAVGNCYFEKGKFVVKTKLAIGYSLDTEEKHTITVDDMFEFDEVVEDRIINDVTIKSNPRSIGSLQVIWETPEFNVKIQNDQQIYDGSNHLMINQENLPLINNSENPLSVRNMTRGMNINISSVDVDTGRVDFHAESLANLQEGDILSLSYSYNQLALLSGQARTYSATFDEKIDSIEAIDVAVWDKTGETQRNYSTTPNNPNTLSLQFITFDKEKNKVTFELKNNYDSPSSISTLQLRGYPVISMNPIEVYSRNTPSINEFERKEYSLDNNYINNIRLAEKISTYIVDNNALPRKVARVSLEGYPEMSLDDVTKLVESSSGINDKFTVERIDYKFDVNNGWTMVVNLLELDQFQWVYESFSGESYRNNASGRREVASIYRGTTEPNDRNVLWIDTGFMPNIPKTYNPLTGQWEKSSPTQASEIGAETPTGAAQKAIDARDEAISYTDSEVAKREMSFFRQSTQPSNPLLSQIWIDTSTTPEVMKRWNGQTWINLTPTMPDDIGAVDKTSYDNKVQELGNNISDKADLSYVDGQLIDKANKNDVFTKTEVTNQLNTKVGTLTYETDMNGVVTRLSDTETAISNNEEQILLRATKTELSTAEGRITDAEASISVIAGEIELKASKDEVYTISQIDTKFLDTASLTEVQGISADVESLTTQVSNHSTSISNNAEQISLKANANDVYTKSETNSRLNGKVDNLTFNSLENRVTDAESSITQTATEIELKINKDEVYTKSETTTLLNGKADSSTVSSLTTRVSAAETNIGLNQDAINLRATKSEVETISSSVSGLSTRMSAAESELSVQSDKIEARVTTTTYNSGLASKENTVFKQNSAPSHSNGRLWLNTSVTPNILYRSTGSAWVKATPTTASEVGAYSSSDGSALSSRLSTAESTITQHSNQIQSRVTTTTYNSGIADAKSHADSKAATAESNAKDYASKLDSITIPDTRSTNREPSWYWSNYPKRIVNEFKGNTAMSIGSTTYGSLTTIVPWSDSSGGSIKQTYENSGVKYYRQSTSNTTWGGWNTVENTAGSQAKVNTLKTGEIDPLKTRVTTAESSITQNATNINLRVQKNQVISEINQSSESIRIAANRIHIDGNVTFSSGYNPKTANDTITSNKSTWDRSGNINSNGTFNTSKLNGTVSDAQVASASTWHSKETTSGAQSKANTAENNAKEVAIAMSSGRMLNADPTFASGRNGISHYNNSGGSGVVINRVSRPSDAPTTSSHILEITHSNVSTSPNHGGFTFQTPSRPNAVFIVKFIAKLSAGRSFQWASNATGDGRITKWLTSNQGTGKYEEYIYKVHCGVSGTFSTTNFFSIVGGAKPFTWQLAYGTVFDTTNNDLPSLWSWGDTTEINGGNIRTNTVTATQINVSSLSALSANLGTVTAGTVNGVTINGSTFNATFNSGDTSAPHGTSRLVSNGLYFHKSSDSGNMYGYTNTEVKVSTTGLQSTYTRGGIGSSSYSLDASGLKFEGQGGLMVSDWGIADLVSHPRIYNNMGDIELNASGKIKLNSNVDVAGYITPSSTANVSHGNYGLYSASRIGHIWSMGTGYRIPNNGANFGNLYGMAYKHTNNSTGGTMAGGHQIVFANNGTAGTAIGLAGGIWTSGSITANAGTFTGPLTVENGNWLNAGALDSVNQHLYIRPESNGEVRMTSIGSTTSYRPIRASQFISSSGGLATTESQFATGSLTVNSVANTVVDVYVPFGKTFSSAPQVVVTPNSSVPQIVSTGVSGVTTTGFTVHLHRTNNTNTIVRWIAVNV